MAEHLYQVPKKLIFILAKIPSHWSLLFLRITRNQLYHAQIMCVKTTFNLIIITVWLCVLVLDRFFDHKPFHALLKLTFPEFQIC